MHKVIITTGGTGGHIFPAIAVAEELRRQYPELEILFVGGTNGPEGEIAAKNGLAFAGLPVKGFIGRGLKAVQAAWLMLKAIWVAHKKIKEFKPDVVMGFGGYAAAASICGAALSGVPVVLHEQNSMPGITNRLAGRLARLICLSMPDAEKWFPAGKCVLTGNPVRSSIAVLYQRKQAQMQEDGMHRSSMSVTVASAEAITATGCNILVLGGSQGAKAINTAIAEDCAALLATGCNIRLQTGKLDFEACAAKFANMPRERVEVSAFIDDMDAAYGWADLAVCRAGASTIAELAVAGLPALFIPFPFATHNHQYFNALQVQKQGAAEVLEQKDIKPGTIAEKLTALLETPQKLQEMSKAALQSARPNAAALIVEEVRELLAKA